MDYQAHNQEVREIWESFRAGTPVRMPVIVGVSDRYYVLNPATNPKGISFREYSQDPDMMFRLQCGFEPYYRTMIPGDHEMGPPEEGWNVNLDFQNYYEAAWLGAEVAFPENEVPYTLPLLREDNKNELFEKGIPDPFGGFMSTIRRFHERFTVLARDTEIEGLPIHHIGMPFLWTDGMFTLACELRGAAQACVDMLECPDYFHQLMDYLTEATIQRLKAWRRYAGEPEVSPYFGFADDSIQLISTEMYQEFVLPYHKRLRTALSTGEEPGFCHLCGNATRHYPLIQRELNIGTFDTGFPVEHAALIRQLRPETVVQGGVPAELVLRGTPEEIRAASRKVIESVRPVSKHFVFREGNDIPPGTPLENMWALYEAGREFGHFG